MAKNTRSDRGRKLRPSERRKLRDAAKKPKTAVEPSAQKRPVPGPPIERDPELMIMFRLRLMDDGGPWSFTDLSKRDVELIAKIAKDSESKTLNEFINVPGNKPIPFENMSAEAQKRATERGLDKVADGLWELRAGGKERLWGVLDAHCFYIVWWDPEHEVCPSTLRNT